MAIDPQLSGRGSTPGQAPWAGRGNMIRLAVSGGVASVLLLAIGIVLQATGHRGAVAIGLGSGFLLVWVVAIPVARWLGKL